MVLKDAQCQLDELTARVRDNMNTGTNVEGFLLGKRSEYALMVDRENFDLRMDLDRELWQAQISNAEETKLQAERIGDYIEDCKNELTLLMKPQGLMPQAQFNAFKRFTFGEQVPLEECTFEWPKVDDLKRLNLKKLPVLREIRFRQTYTSCIGSV